MQLGTWVADFADALAFLSRLPVERWHASSSRGDAAFLRFAPMAGVVIAAGPCALLAIVSSFGLPSLPVAVLAVALAVGITGALHEDGLADVADGFGGGKSREQKLSIMRDSRIGTFGAAALGCSLLLRASCVSAVLDRSGAAHATVVLVVAAASSRAAMLLPMALLQPARTDGLARLVGRLPRSALLTASVLALAIAACASAWLPARTLMLALVSGSAASLAVTRLARRQIGGMTGDVIGAAQQVAEIAVLLTLASA